MPTDVVPTEARKRGPKPKLTPAMEQAMLLAYKNEAVTSHEVAQMFGVCRATLHRIVAKHKKQNTHRTNPVGA